MPTYRMDSPIYTVIVFNIPPTGKDVAPRNTRQDLPLTPADANESWVLRIFGIRFFRLLVNVTAEYRVTDTTSGFFAINRRLVTFYSTP